MLVTVIRILVCSCWVCGSAIAQSIDPLELDQDWEYATEVNSNGTSIAKTNLSTGESISIEATTNLSTTLDQLTTSIEPTTTFSTQESTIITTQLTTTSLPEQIQFIEENDEDEQEESKPESTNKKSKIAFQSQEDAKESSEARAEQLRPILQQSLLQNPLRNVTKTNSTSSTQVWSTWVRLLEIMAGEGTILNRNLITPLVLDQFYALGNLSGACLSGFLALDNGVQAGELWAAQMLDSSGRMPSGLLSGTSSAFGDYDQCLSVVGFDETRETLLVQGKYCLLEVGLPVPELPSGVRAQYDSDQHFSELRTILQNNETNFQLNPSLEPLLKKLVTSFYSSRIYNGICVPADCSKHDLELLFTTFIGTAIEVKVEHCQVNKEPEIGDVPPLLERACKLLKDFWNKLDRFQLIAIATISISMLLVGVATFIDFARDKWIPDNCISDTLIVFVNAFSVCSNWNVLFLTKPEVQHRTDMRFVSGMRTFAMVWVVMCHVANLGTLFAPEVIYRFEEEARPFGRSLLMQFIFNGYVSVEVFFFLSGLVLVFLGLANQKASRSSKTRQSLIRLPSFTPYAGVRAFRLLTPMIGLMALQFVWLLFLGSGPVYGKFSGQLQKACYENYWKNLLLINNYDKTNEICLVHTWFISADFQLHLVAYPLLLLYTFSESLGLAANLTLILTGALVPAFLIHKRRSPPTLSAFLEVQLDQYYTDMKLLYHPAYAHASCYFVGVLFGYLLLRKLKNPESENHTEILKSPNSFKLIANSVIAIFVSGASVFAAWAWSRPAGALISDPTLGALYHGFHKLIFILGPVWVVFACISYPGNFISKALSWTPFQIVGRLSFSIYMVHILVVWHWVITTRSLIRFQLADIIFNTGGVLILSIPLAIWFHLLFEAPWSALLRQFRARKAKSIDLDKMDQLERCQENLNSISNH